MLNTEVYTVPIIIAIELNILKSLVSTPEQLIRFSLLFTP